MKIEKGDYVIVHNPKKLLLQVQETNDDNFTGFLTVINPTSDEYAIKDILCNLGKNPPYKGNALSISLERYYRTSDSDFGEINWYFKPSKEERTLLTNALNLMYKKLDKINATSFLPLEDGVSVKLPRGKYTGMYTVRGARHGMILMPKEADYSNSNLDYVIAHESGHGVWATSLSEKTQGMWTKLYHESVTVKKLPNTDKQVKLILSWIKDANKSGTYLSDLISQMSEEQEEIFYALTEHVYTHHKLNLEDLDVLSSTHDLTATLFPTEIYVSEIDAVITEYATKNVHEFFAEAFAFHISGKKLPNSVLPLMNYTLGTLK